MVRVLPDDKDRPTEGFQPADVLAGLCEIRSAEPESSGFAREIRADRETQSLIRWADAKGALWTEERPPKADELTGGEHFVTLGFDGRHVFKSTKPGKFGFAADLEMIRPLGWKAKPRITAGLVDGTPTEYLKRLGWQNELFGDGIRVIGVTRYPQGISVLTTQPFYDGKRTDQADINAWFEGLGWRRLPAKDGAFYNVAKDLLVMDALPRNVLTLELGKVMPFDVVIVMPDEMLKSKLDL
ncbi:MAG: hypothetical protein WCO57_07355 [Verrucomicrobiota bacterium]